MGVLAGIVGGLTAAKLGGLTGENGGFGRNISDPKMPIVKQRNGLLASAAFPYILL